MYLLKKPVLKKMLAKEAPELWMTKVGAWNELDIVVETVIKDIFKTVVWVHGQEKRKKATAQDIRNAYNKHKEKYIAEAIVPYVKRMAHTAAQQASAIAGEVRTTYAETQTKIS